MGLSFGSLPNGITSADLLKMDAKSLGGLKGTSSGISDTLSANLSTITQRLGPQSLSRESASSNTFVTQDMMPMISDVDFRNQMDAVKDWPMPSIDKLRESTGFGTIDTNDALEKATGLAGSNMVAGTASALAGGLATVKEAAGDAYEYVSDAFGTIDFPDIDVPDIGKLDIPGIDLGGLNNQLSRLGDTIDLNDYTDSLKLGYPTITNNEGFPVYGYPTTVSYSTADGLSRMANSLCGTSLKDLFDFGLNKNLFNMLLQAVLGNGISGLLDDLLGCAKYVDNMSKQQVSDYLPTLASNGDLNSVTSAFNGIGSGSISGVESSLRTLSRSTSYSTSNVNGIKGLVNTSSSFDKLFKTNTSIGSGYDTRYMTGTNASSTKTLGALLGTDTVNMANALPW